MTQVVIAWTVESSEWDGKPYASDMGRAPRMRVVDVGHACMWLIEASGHDIANAHAYCERENKRLSDGESGRVVMTFPDSEADPLGKAKAAAVAALRAKHR